MTTSAPVVLAAVDKFKGTLSAAEVVEHLTRGILSACPAAQVVGLPIADGGEGTVEAALSAGFSRRTVTVTGPTGHPVEAALAVRGQTAVIEMAAASGLMVLPGGVLDALGATSRGTGELIAAALDMGCSELVLGVGGSACTDGGAGMLQALGVRITDAAANPVPPGGARLHDAAAVDLSGLDHRVRAVSFVLACDVDNPLTGEHGAAAVYGPQKGASADDVRLLDDALQHWAAVLEDHLGPAARGMSQRPGAGAAGGVGYAALAVLGAQLHPGVDVVLDLVAFEDAAAKADLVVTGEGSLDRQSLHGKAPVGVARRAGKHGIPVVAVAGQVSADPADLAQAGIARAYALIEVEPDLDRCMEQAGPVLEQLAARVATEWLGGTG